MLESRCYCYCLLLLLLFFPAGRRLAHFTTVQGGEQAEHRPTPRPTRPPPPIASSPSVVLGCFTPNEVEYAALGRATHDCKLHHHVKVDVEAPFEHKAESNCKVAALGTSNGCMVDFTVRDTSGHLEA
jgi:hypothetical protein